MCDRVLYETDEKYQLDATILIYYHKIYLHVSATCMPIFRSTGCMLLHMVGVRYKLTHSAQDYTPAP